LGDHYSPKDQASGIKKNKKEKEKKEKRKKEKKKEKRKRKKNFKFEIGGNWDAHPANHLNGQQLGQALMLSGGCWVKVDFSENEAARPTSSVARPARASRWP